MADMFMKATSPVKEATIEGHTYSNIGKDGVIKVMQGNHIPTLKMHGFVEHFPVEEDAAEKIANMSDKDELVTFIEEHGGEADNSMTLKKLRRLALESLEE